MLAPREPFSAGFFSPSGHRLARQRHLTFWRETGRPDRLRHPWALPPREWACTMRIPLRGLPRARTFYGHGFRPHSRASPYHFSQLLRPASGVRLSSPPTKRGLGFAAGGPLIFRPLPSRLPSGRVGHGLVPGSPKASPPSGRPLRALVSNWRESGKLWRRQVRETDMLCS